MQEHPGGMDGILNQLKQNGLADQVQSWDTPGEKKAISPEQVQQGSALRPQKPLSGGPASLQRSRAKLP